MRLSELKNLNKINVTDKYIKLHKDAKNLKDKIFSKEAEEVCKIIFQKKIIEKSSLTSYFSAKKKDHIIPFIEEGRELFRITILKKLGGYI